jgi:hypothetical protein
MKELLTSYIECTWGKNYLRHTLNVHGVNDVGHTEMHMAESLVTKTSPFKVEIAIEKLKSYKMTRYRSNSNN